MSRQGKVEAYEYVADADLAANGGLQEGPKTKINIENLVAGAVLDASTTVKGKVELATVAEAEAGTDTTRAVTPEGLAAAIAAGNQPTRLRIQFTTHPSTPTLSVILNETALDDNQFVASRTGDGVYSITAASPIFDDRAMAWGGWVRQSGSDYGSNVRKHSTTVIRVYTYNQNTGSFTDDNSVVPVFVDIYP